MSQQEPTFADLVEECDPIDEPLTVRERIVFYGAVGCASVVFGWIVGAALYRAWRVLGWW